MPSRWSGVPNSPTNSSRSRARPGAPGVSTAAWTAAFAAARAARGPYANSRACATARARTSEAGTTRSASPSSQGADRVELRTGHDEAERARRSQQPGEALRAAGAGDHADLDLRLPDRGVLGQVPQVGAERELEPAAQRVAGDGGDRDLRHGLEGVDRVAEGATPPGGSPRRRTRPSP